MVECRVGRGVNPSRLWWWNGFGRVLIDLHVPVEFLGIFNAERRPKLAYSAIRRIFFASRGLRTFEH